LRAHLRPQVSWHGADVEPAYNGELFKGHRDKGITAYYSQRW
jgi:hypothetical protein